MKMQHAQVSARQEMVGIVNDSILNIFGIKVLGDTDKEFDTKLKPSIKSWRAAYRKTKLFDAWIVDNLDSVMITIMSAVQIFLLASLYQKGEITAGSFAFVGKL